MAEGKRMIRYCKNCALFIQPKIDRRYDETCPVCNWDVFFTLRQRHYLQLHFSSKQHSAASLTVRRGLLSHSGESGIIVDAWEYGVNIDFFGPAPSILAYDWDEVEVEHILPEDQPELGLEHVRTPVLGDLKIGDRVMLRNGKDYKLNRKIRTRDRSIKFGLSGIDILGADTISEKTMHKIVDWLTTHEMKSMAEQMKMEFSRTTP